MIIIKPKVSVLSITITGNDIDILQEVCDIARIFLQERRENKTPSGLNVIIENKVHGFIFDICNAEEKAVENNDR